MNSFIYLVGTLASAALPFLMMPIMTSVLQPSEYGTMILFVTLYSFIYPVLSLNAPSYIQRCYFDKDGLTREKFWKVVRVLSFYSIFPIVLLLIFHDVVFSLFSLDDYGMSLMLVLIVTAMLFIGYEILLLLYNAKGEAIKYSVFLLLQSGMVFLFSIIFLFKGWDSLSRVYGTALTNLIMFAISFFFILSILNSRSESRTPVAQFLVEKDFLKYSFGFMPHVLFSLLLGVFDKMLIAKFLSISDVSTYAIISQYSAVLLVISQGLNREWVKKFYKNGVTKKNISYRNNLILILIFLVFCFYFFSDIFYVFFVDERYERNELVLLFLLLSQLCHMIYMVFSVKLNYEKKSLVLSKLTFLSLFLNVVISLVLIGEYGLIGVALGTFIGMLSKMIFVIYVSSKPRLNLS
ncbi:hypothetical protein CBF23_010635 [Marinomonas agarivorans]|nr:hypothetical protein CBF23_010635 [Marinomonas agarivorans]